MRRTLAALPLLMLLSACRPAKPVAAEAPDKPAQEADHDTGLTLSKESQARAGVRTEPLSNQAVDAQLTAFGRLEEDPSLSFTVRAPVTGTLLSVPGHPWPALGQTLPDRVEIGRIEPRLNVTDRISVNTQLANARAELLSSDASLKAAQAAYDRARILNEDNKNVSDRALEEAAARLASEKTRHEAAASMIGILEKPPASVALESLRGGEVVEVLAQPGESIEQGAPIARLARFNSLLARIDLPVGQAIPPASSSARIIPAGFEDHAPLAATRVSLLPASEPQTQGTALLYRLSSSLTGLRPGLAITARFSMPGSAAQGLVIPRAAVVRQEGRAWVYVQVKPDHFDRRPVATDVPTANGFFVSGGFAPGDRVVVAGAQSLLSEEFKSQNEADTN